LDTNWQRPDSHHRARRFCRGPGLGARNRKLAEAANHHPDIDIRYRAVHLRLSTHDAGHTVTAKDYSLAQKINDLSEDAIRLTKDDLHRRFKG